MQHIGTITGRALTEARELSTRAKPISTETLEKWAKWAEFKIEGDENEREQLARMVTAVGKFCLDVQEGRPARWLTFLGASGCGKTYLAKRIWRWHRASPRFVTRMTRGADGRSEIVYPGHFCFWPTVAGELSGNSGYEHLEELSTEWLVVIDEIGADRDPNGHVKDCLARVLSSRVNKWTVITSNKTLDDIAERIDPRIASRMIRDGSEVVQVDLVDYALRAKE